VHKFLADHREEDLPRVFKRKPKIIEKQETGYVYKPDSEKEEEVEDTEPYLSKLHQPESPD
jgi:hypothetical protein